MLSIYQKMPNLYHPLNIGPLSLDGNLFLAPLAGYTDRVFRQICLDMGANLAYTEMVSTEGVARENDKTTDLMRRSENEKNLCIQIFMNNTSSLERALPYIVAFNPALIDINCGCPVPKVVKTGAGSALMKNPKLIQDFVKIIVKETNIPVSLKIRTGWDQESQNYLEITEKIIDAGASAITMHARTKSQYYKPFADWSKLKDLKSHFPNFTVIGSGDLFQPEDAKRMMEETGIDAIMFARGAIGNPFIFQQTKDLLMGKEYSLPSAKQRANAILDHLYKLEEDYGEESSCKQLRKHIGCYLKGIPGTAKIKKNLMTASSFKDYQTFLIDLF